MLVNKKHNKKIASAALTALTACTAMSGALASDISAQVAALPVAQIQKPLASVNGARPDISALRYYAVRGEQGRVHAEINRLRKLYPGWTQPENIFAEDDSIERDLWKLYSEGKTEAVKEKIAKLQEEPGGYVPSSELLNKLEQRENRTGIAAAWEAKDWDGVLNQANANPALLANGDIELIWFVGEAYALKEKPDEAFEAFLAALKSANSQQERKATVQKAAVLLSTDRALKLLEGTPELKKDKAALNEVKDAIVRGALARSAEFGEATPKILEAEVLGFETRAKMSKSSQDAVLLAWSKFGQRDWKSANNWFAHALTFEQTPKAIEGAIMSSMRLGALDRAASLAGQHIEASKEIAALFISVHAPALLQAKPPQMDSRFLSVYAGKASDLNNGEGAEALGWYAFNVAQLDAADAWFSKAMDWEETETAVFGKTLTAGRRKDRATFDFLQQAYGAKYPKVAALKYQVEKRRRKAVGISRKPARVSRAGSLRGKIAKLYQAKQYSKCLQLSRQLRQYGPLRAGDHEMRGWCLLGAKRPSESERAFAAAVRLGGKSKNPSAYGQALAALRSGKTNQALTIANANRLTRKQRRVIDIELLTQRARAAFNNRDYAAVVHALDKRGKITPESRDLTMMRAWAHYHGGRLSSARAIFASLDQQLSTRDTRKGLNATKQKFSKLISTER